MSFSIFCIVLVSVLAVGVPGVHGDFGMRHCWPGNETISKCFAKLTKLEELFPTESQDSYTAGSDEDAFDFEDFSVTQVQKDPSHICGYRELLIWAMNCTIRAMVAKCPHLPKEMVGHVDRLRLAFNNFCSRTRDVDPLCMQKHWDTTMMCKTQIMRDYGKSLGMSFPHKPHHSKKSPPPKSSSWGSHDPTQSPDVAADHHQHHEAQSAPRPSSETKWKPGSSDPLKGDMNEKMCFFKHNMMTCVKRTMTSCHKKTAEVMAQFMKDMANEDCAAKMDAWTLAAQDCEGPGCSGVGHLGGTTFGVALLAVFAAMFVA